MENTVLKKILEDNLKISNATNGKWIKLYPQVSMLMLANDSREYVQETTLYKIDLANKKIYTSENHDGSFDPNGEYTVKNIYNIPYIDAVICSSVQGPYGSYYTRPF